MKSSPKAVVSQLTECTRRLMAYPFVGYVVVMDADPTAVELGIPKQGVWYEPTEGLQVGL